MLKPFYNKKKNIDNRLLPLATAADAGKFVGVTDEGKFGLVEGGGASEILIVHPTVDGQGNVVLDKTYSEMLAHLTEDKPVLCMNAGIASTRMSYNNNTITFYFESTQVDKSLNRATFDRTGIAVAADNTVSVFEDTVYWTVTFFD